MRAIGLLRYNRGMPRCKHDWRVRGSRERCELCGTTFPCTGDCRHWDCRVEKGQDLPDWVTYKNTNEEKR